MNFMVNCTVLTGGGGITVADSVCSYLRFYPQHKFYVILSKETEFIKNSINTDSNVSVLIYSMKRNIRTLFFHRDSYLDKLVIKYNIDAVLSIFGPTHWTPRCLHLCGFARPHIVFPDSPFFKQLSILKRIKERIFYRFLLWQVKKNSKCFYTENPQVSKRLKELIRCSSVWTITNNYHQIFDQPEKWKEIVLPKFGGITLLIFTTPSLHKYIQITVKIARILKIRYPKFKFRFAITITQEELNGFTPDLSDCFLFLGRVKIEEGPSLYKQSDIMFLPSLLECFSANYAEAMRMRLPIITTDLEFAHGTCSEAACYYNPLSPESAANAIFKVSTDPEYRNQLIRNGISRLADFDTPEKRVKKMIDILENLVKTKYE